MRLLALAMMLLAGTVAWANDESDALATIEREVFEAVNAHRESVGLDILSENEAMKAAARDHSRAMASGRVAFGHDGFRRRSQRIGKTLLFSAMAENISKHQRELDDVPEAAMQRWLASPVHRKHLESDFDASGVGAAQSDDGTLYVTQIFAVRR